jgi:hypothetical protein
MIPTPLDVAFLGERGEMDEWRLWIWELRDSRDWKEGIP